MPITPLILKASIVILVSAILQASTGFGFSILSTPFLLSFFPARDAIQISLLFTLLISLGMLRSTYSEIDKVLLKRLSWSSIVGIPCGIVVFWLISLIWIKWLLAVAILGSTLFLVLQRQIARSRRKDVIAGFLSGLLTTSVGVPGPPLLIYMTGSSMDKAIVRSTTLTFYIVVYSVGIISEWVTGGFTAHLLATTIFLLPSMFLGIWIGKYVFLRFTPVVFRRTQLAILLFTGLYLLFSILSSTFAAAA
ncbi:sulfite exporter TauE/SafE family protein [Fodinisporobacter ferrooxydans]|uniref:Probable membrane transporter protein n=1 Tax=Fodinisporobacter ferrooxydans TaxID=2901836 RepID=A0ABY4CDM2_9BACL|nr:sulfite exporter TauE/SafE family protein [Alicyclobacillaceae bacterium MYW30-H2]